MSVTINGTTGISGVAGSASAPALVGSDADSGYYINSANEPSASVNGTAVWNAASTFGFKNRIINAAMVIDQRNAGASVTPATAGAGTYTLDRWNGYQNQASKFTVQQNAGSVTPPAGFTNYAGITSSSAYSLGATDIFLFRQSIEGYNVADLAWGTANAKTVTLSFWVYSSLTGTFGGCFINSDQNRSYPFTYTINAANTWEQKTVTVTGDTSGTWNKTNGIGLGVYFGLGVGSTYSGTAGSWSGTVYYSATGATSVVGTNGATWYVTGVQLEVGSTATSFDFRSIGTELALCQRYFEKSYPLGNAVGTATAAGAYEANNTSYSNSIAYGPPLSYKVIKRANPTITAYDYSGTVGSWHYARSGVSETSTSFTASSTGNDATIVPRITVGAAWVPCYVIGHWTASAEL